MVVLLDNIRSAFNVGSILRTADAVGVEQVILGGHTPGPIDRFGRVNERVTKVSLGAEKSVSIAHEEDLFETVSELKKRNFVIVALEQHKGSQNIFKKINILHANLALILGSEVDGISPRLLSLCDYILEIPMYGSKESLNVAVAFGIAAYALMQEEPTTRA